MPAPATSKKLRAVGRTSSIALAVAAVVGLLVVSSLVGSLSLTRNASRNNTSSQESLLSYSESTSTIESVASGTTTTANSVSNSSASSSTSSLRSTATSSTTTTQQTSVHQLPESTGIVIPLYTNYSTSKWSEVIQAKLSHSTVPIVAIVNPHIGPGTYYNSSFAAGVKRMQQAGIMVLGYVWTDYGAKNGSYLDAQMQAYSTWYAVNGIFLDGMANSLRSPSGAYMPAYYANLTAYSKSIGMTIVFGNPGADVPVQFVGTVDTLGIFENSFLPSLKFLGGWHAKYNKTNFAFVSYNVTSLSSMSSYIVEASNFVGYLFLSNMTRSHYPSPPPYLNQLVATLGSMTSVTVESLSQDHLLLPGALNASITYADGSSITETTPFRFQAYAGSTVQISVEDNGANTFKHWEDGSTLRAIALIPIGPVILKAYVGSKP